MSDYNEFDVIVIGAGLSGCVIAERFANAQKKVLILEKRDHIGGNCYDYIDDNGILINKYGAHIFHTNSEEVWTYVNSFDNWSRWEHSVVGFVDNKHIPIPVNITTVNMLCNENLQNENEMDDWLKKVQIKYDHIENGEQLTKSRVGETLYTKIFKDYTYKQWNKYPEELKPEVLSRIPIKNNFDTRYFSDKYQALPEKGYTEFFKKLIDSNNITVELNVNFLDIRDNISPDKTIIYTGPIDNYFANAYEKLEYRSINFVHESHKNMNYYQTNSVVNYPERTEKFTRIVEYKHFLNQISPHTTIVKEYTTDNGDPYYPVLNERNLALYEKYKILADKEMEEKNIHFVGRLANYKYFNMDQAISNALDYYNSVLIN
jgi:UDP-galactopyranose mutase